MQDTIESRIASIAADFAVQLVSAVGKMSLAEIMSVVEAPKARGGRSAPRGRKPAGRSARGAATQSGSGEDATTRAIVATLRATPGLRAEEIRAKLGLTRKDIDRPIVQAIASKQIRKTGERRATRYFAV